MMRKVGPSKEDIVNADKNKLPIIVYDYVGVKDPETGVYYVIGGHKVSDPKKMYIYQPKK